LYKVSWGVENSGVALGTKLTRRNQGGDIPVRGRCSKGAFFALIRCITVKGELWPRS